MDEILAIWITQLEKKKTQIGSEPEKAIGRSSK